MKSQDKNGPPPLGGSERALTREGTPSETEPSPRGIPQQPNPLRRGGIVSGRPWLKFFPADWLADLSLSSCSLEAQGAWIRLLCYMHQSEPYGELRIGGHPPDDAQLGALLGLSANSVWDVIRELEGSGVLARTEDGAIVSRRMVRDDVKYKQARVYGAKGGNPALLGDKGGLIARDKPSLASSFSLSSDPTEVTKTKTRARGKPTTVQAELVEWWCACWKHYRETDYSPQTKDFVIAAKLLKLASVDEIRSRACNLLESEDKFYIKAADLPLLHSQWNKLAGRIEA